MTSPREPECMTCKHLRRPETMTDEEFAQFQQIEEDDGAICKAFPEGIPEEIFEGPVSHKTPYPGDHGIQWEEW